MEKAGIEPEIESKEEQLERSLDLATAALTKITETTDGILRLQIAENALSELRRLRPKRELPAEVEEADLEE